ncbi:cytochrome P450 [Kitasatospora sp. NPDC059327]|uniref:cytochrome P450 n=1 Tax=Kitasatospora sp. NPDC059327 TaxID=3346803 RepID=UPI0036B2A5D2
MTEQVEAKCPFNHQGEALAYPFGDPGRLHLSPSYAAARTGEGLARVQPPFGGQAWLATRYEDVKTVMADPRFSRAASIAENTPRLVPFMPPPDTIMALDPPHHTRLRRVLNQAFTMRRVEVLRPRIQEITDELLDAIAKGPGKADLVHSFALPVSLIVITELLGVPYEDREKFGAWVGAIFSMETPPEVVQQSNIDLMTYLAGLIAQRREQPAEDLLSILVQARDENDRLTEQEMIGLGAAVLMAGYEVTSHHLGSLTYALLADPAKLAELQADLGLVPQAIEEMLRFVPPAVGEGMTRIATEDVELGGVLVKAGDAVLPSTMAANRDAEVFEDAEVMDFHRAKNPHLSFGHGPHHCVGANLARLELQIAITSLLKRFPALRLDGTVDDVPWDTASVWSGPRELPVLF